MAIRRQNEERLLRRHDAGSGSLKRPASSDGAENVEPCGGEAKRLRLSDSEKLHAESTPLRGATASPASTMAGGSGGAEGGGEGTPATTSAGGPSPLVGGPELAAMNSDISVIFTGFGVDDVSTVGIIVDTVLVQQRFYRIVLFRHLRSIFTLSFQPARVIRARELSIFSETHLLHFNAKFNLLRSCLADKRACSFSGNVFKLLPPPFTLALAPALLSLWETKMVALVGAFLEFITMHSVGRAVRIGRGSSIEQSLGTC